MKMKVEVIKNKTEKKSGCNFFYELQQCLADYTLNGNDEYRLLSRVTQLVGRMSGIKPASDSHAYELLFHMGYFINIRMDHKTNTAYLAENNKYVPASDNDLLRLVCDAMDIEYTCGYSVTSARNILKLVKIKSEPLTD